MYWFDVGTHAQTCHHECVVELSQRLASFSVHSFFFFFWPVALWTLNWIDFRRPALKCMVRCFEYTVSLIATLPKVASKYILMSYQLCGITSGQSVLQMIAGQEILRSIDASVYLVSEITTLQLTFWETLRCFLTFSPRSGPWQEVATSPFSSSTPDTITL